MNSDPSSSNELALLPQYGFGATYAFEALVEHHHFLYRVHTPKRPGTLSRPASPSPRPGSSFHRPELTRSPSSLSSSVASIRTVDSGASDYFTFAPGHPGDEDDSAPGDPYFLSRRFKDDLTSPDPGRRRRTLSTLSTLSGGSTTHSYNGSEDGSDAEYELSPRARRGNLARSTSMMLGHSRVRSDSLSNSRPGAKRSQSADIRQRPLPAENTEGPGGANMSYADLVRHLDWTTRSSSPYVTTSFSFFWCLWEAVRRYKLGVKHDVEIAVIDARKVRGRAKTALEVLRNVEADRQDKAYWKWFRFAQESQDVLVFGAIPGDAIYASIPLTQILPKLPSYFFVDEIPKPLEDPREPDEAIDPRSPTSRVNNPIFPTTPGRPQTPNQDRERERERERKFTAHLLTTLAWDIGTTMKPIRKLRDAPNPTPGKPTPRHSSHADFCKALSASFAKRSETDQLRDATTGVVNLAELLVEPWFRARCAEGAAYLFRHDDDDEESDDEKVANEDRRSLSESVCLGLAGDGCALEHSHDSSIQDALFGADKDDETEEEAAKREAAGVLSELALSLTRWPATWWYEEHAGTVEGLISDVVKMCVTEAARGVQGRIAWGIALESERERKRTLSMSGSVRGRADSMNLSGSPSESLRSERRGREETREKERKRSRSPFAGTGLKHARRASEGSPSPKPWPLRESPYKPRARSPLGTTPALGPAIVIRPKSKPKAEATSEPKPAQEQDDVQTWSPSTPPPSPPLKFSASEGNLGNATPSRRKSPPLPPPRSDKRPPSPTQSISSSLASIDSPSPSPNSSPSASLSSSLLKRSVQRRAESLPGGWPGDESPREERSESLKEQPAAGKQEEGDLFWDPTVRSQAKARPLSWAGSGMALGAVSSASSPAARSQKSGVESSRDAARSSPSSSPSSSILRQRPHTSSDAQAREALLTEVVSSALGLGAGVVAGVSAIASSGSPLRLDTSPSSSSTHGSERSSVSSHHRRHSSHGHVHPLDIELSPVREVEQEDEVEVEAERANLEGTTGSDESVGADYGEGKADATAGRAAGSELVSDPVQADGADISDESKNEESVSGDASGNEAIANGIISEITLGDRLVEDRLASPQGSGTSTPRSERRRSRSGTLASIPEEDWAEWSLVEAPTASELEADAKQREVTVIEPADIPLPPSSTLEMSELSDDVHDPLPRDTEPVGAAKSGEGQGASSKVEVRQVPEITLTTDSTSSAAADERALAEDSNLKAEDKSNALTDSRHFSVPALARSRALMRTFIALPTVNLFRTLSPGQGSRFPSPSPVFEDTDATDSYIKVSPFFSLFRIPIRATTRFFRRRRQELRRIKPGRSMTKILSPPAAWNSPILDPSDSYPYAEQSANGVNGVGGEDRRWDAEDTNWVMSCFVCGVMATLAIASDRQQLCEMHMMVGNRYH